MARASACSERYEAYRLALHVLICALAVVAAIPRPCQSTPLRVSAMRPCRLPLDFVVALCVRAVPVSGFRMATFYSTRLCVCSEGISYGGGSSFALGYLADDVVSFAGYDVRNAFVAM